MVTASVVRGGLSMIGLPSTRLAAATSLTALMTVALSPVRRAAPARAALSVCHAYQFLLNQVDMGAINCRRYAEEGC